MIKVKFRPKNKELEKGEPVCSLHSLGNQEQGETGFGWLSLIPIVIPIVRSALRMGGGALLLGMVHLAAPIGCRVHEWETEAH